MLHILMSIGSKPAAEGFGGVISSALLAGGTLALIYLVLVLIDRHYKKTHSNDDKTAHTEEDRSPTAFRYVLAKEIDKKNEKDVSSKHE